MKDKEKMFFFINDCKRVLIFTMKCKITFHDSNHINMNLYNISDIKFKTSYSMKWLKLHIPT